MNDTVFILFHTIVRGNAEEGRILGVFRTAQAAVSAVQTLRSQPGFRDQDETAFVAAEYSLNADEWPDGFLWSGEGSRTPPNDWRVDIALIDDQADLFLLQHRRISGQFMQTCMIGAYSSEADVVAAAERASRKPGFRALYDGLVAYGLALDKLHWTSGFKEGEAKQHRLLTIAIS